MNTVRRHLSAIKGGRLAAAAHPARVVSLIISDVPGDDPAAIASGPTVADPTTFAESPRRSSPATASSRRPRCSAHLAAARDETPKPGDPRLAGVETIMIATPQLSLEAAAAVASKRGDPLILGDALEGEAAEVGKVMAGIARSVVATGHPLPAPCVLLGRRDHGDGARRGAAGATSSSCSASPSR